jgi:hypothetical protein
VRLLDGCITALSELGMQRVFVDAIPGNDEGFHAMSKIMMIDMMSMS